MSVPTSTEIPALSSPSRPVYAPRSSSLTLHTHTQSHIGLQRSSNQDFAYLDPKGGFMILADGMGGRAGGEIASRVATSAARSILEEHRFPPTRDTNALLIQAYDAAFQAVIQNALHTPAYARMGTTLICAVWTASQDLVVGSIGDSRVYRLRGETLLQMTRDHTLRAELLSEGLITSYQARSAPRLDHILTRSVSARGKGRPEITRSKVRVGDRFVIATDGLFGVVPDAKIQEVLIDAPSEDMACSLLIDAALRAGGPDNITVVACFVGS